MTLTRKPTDGLNLWLIPAGDVGSSLCNTSLQNISSDWISHSTNPEQKFHSVQAPLVHMPSFPWFYSLLVVVCKKSAASAQAPFHPFLWLVSPVSMWHRGASSVPVRWNECSFAKMLMPLSGPYQAIVLFVLPEFPHWNELRERENPPADPCWGEPDSWNFSLNEKGLGVASDPVLAPIPRRNQGDKHSLAWWVLSFQARLAGNVCKPSLKSFSDKTHQVSPQSSQAVSMGGWLCPQMLLEWFWCFTGAIFQCRTSSRDVFYPAQMKICVDFPPFGFRLVLTALPSSQASCVHPNISVPLTSTGWRCTRYRGID